MSYSHLGVHISDPSGSNQVTQGAPGGSSDGINWPYDQNGETPNFQIDWNDPTQVEATYLALQHWLASTPSSPAFYNGCIMFLQMTVDIGKNLSKYSPDQQKALQGILNNQMTDGGDGLFLQDIIQIAAQGTAVASADGNTGYANAKNFLTQLMNVANSIPGHTFDVIASEANTELGTDPANTDSIYNWIFGSSSVTAHWGQIQDAAGGYINTWLDDEGSSDGDSSINGQQAMTFEEFTVDAHYALGMDIDPDTNSSVGGTIDADYQTQIQELVAQFKGDPWALLVALMSLMNDRDKDNGTAVNGYGGTLDVVKQANSLIQKMIIDMSGTKPSAANIADFYKQLAQLKDLVGKDPGLASTADQFVSDISSINNTAFTPAAGQILSWTIQTAGYYNFPPGSTVTINGESVTVDKTGRLYIEAGSKCTFDANQNDPTTGKPYVLTFGSLAAMGDTDDVAANMGGWDSQSMSNFENGVTGLQTLINSPSSAIQAQIQNLTQTMQATENFEKEAYDSITNVNQQVMKLVQSVMG